MKNIKIIFIGTSQFAVPILEKLIQKKYQIISVVTAPDKPAGRKQTITPPPIKQISLQYHLPILQPQEIIDATEQIKQMQPDLIILAAYGQIIPQKILAIPRFGAINLHPSLLPKYRGPSPIQTAILNNEKITGVTVMLMDEKIDHGPILAQKKVAISPDETYQSLESKLAILAADLLIETLMPYLQGHIKPKQQNESQATYTQTLTRDDGQIDWHKTALEIERQVRAFSPWPGAWTYFNGQRIKILRAKAISQPKEKELTLPTGQGFLVIEQLQPAGKNPMTGQEYLRGHSYPNLKSS